MCGWWGPAMVDREPSSRLLNSCERIPIQIGMSKMRQEAAAKALFYSAIVLALGGFFYLALWIFAIPCLLTAIILRLGGSRTAQLLGFASVACTGISIGGLFWLFATRGTYHYSVVGYIVIFVPFVAGATAVALILAFVQLRRTERKRQYFNRESRHDRSEKRKGG